ncbi:methyltransferase domain-containing protein, partial [Metallibacterium scheffleri]|uniref:methyltransferase domain-containing protein n=1 Tax=Metallibacterium scheffleri TaxID=993689 RepID=UPI0023F26012
MNSDVFEIAVKGMIFRYRICPGVYPPSEDTYLLLESLTPGKKVLEIGCGSGLLSVYCAALGSEVTAVDINPISSSLQHSLNDGMQLSVVCSEDVPWLT